MEDESSTKVDFVMEVFPNLSKQDILTRLNSAPASERSTDALVAFFLAEQEKAEVKKNEDINIDTDANIHNTNTEQYLQTEEEHEGTLTSAAESHKSKYLIRDDDLDESVEEVSPDPVVYPFQPSAPLLHQCLSNASQQRYSAETGRIEKSADQLQQEEDDLKLAQKLYEDDLLRLQQNPPSQPYQPTYISPYHKPPPPSQQRPLEQTKNKNSSTSTTTINTSKTLPPSKRQAVRSASETIKKSSTDIAAQLQEVRKQRESQWRESGGKALAAGSNQQGFNAGYYNQLKDIRNKQNRDWHDKKVTQKRVWTIGDMEKATRQAHIDSGRFDAGDSLAVQIGKEAVYLTNNFRKENKLPPLAWHAALCTIGTQHSKNMAEHKVPFGHDGFDGRVRQYPMAHRSAAENVAMSRGITDVAQTAVHGWINSPGHRKNLLSHSEYCGIGCYQGADGSWYLTQLFAG